MLGFCIHVGLLPRFPAWSTVLEKGELSQITVHVVSLFHLEIELLEKQPREWDQQRGGLCAAYIHEHQRAVGGTCR